MDMSFLLGAQGVQAPNMLQQATQAATLGDLLNRGQLQSYALKTQQRADATNDAMNRALPGVMQGNWSPETIRAAIQANPDAASGLLKMLEDRQKAQADTRKSNAIAGKDEASARVELLKPLTNQAFALANKPDLSPDDIKQWSTKIADAGLQGLVQNIPFQDWNNPEQARKNLKIAGNAFFEAEKQVSTAETGRHNLTTEGLTQSAQAETGRHNKAEEGIQGGNLAVARGHLLLGQQTADPFGTLNINPKPPQGGAAGPGAQNAHGDEYLKSLPGQLADQVKALAEGHMQFPGSFALKTPYWQNMLSAVAQYDPSFDAVNYSSRAATRKDFTAGKSAQSLNALNTVAGHLETLADAAKNLNNFGGIATPLNAPVNAVQSALGDPRVQQFNIARKTVADEMVRAYRGAGGSEKDIQEWMTLLNANGSPEQQAANLAQVSELLSSKINALGEQYKQGMGTTSAPIQLTTPKAQGVFDKLEAARSGSKPPTDTKGWSIQRID